MHFCFFISQKNQTSCTSFLQTGTWNLSNYFGCFLKIFLSFSEQRSNFREVFPKTSYFKKTWWNVVLLYQWSKVGKRYMQIYWKLHSLTGIFQRIWLQIQNSDIEKCISMATSEDIYFWENSWSAASLQGRCEVLILKVPRRNQFNFLVYGCGKNKKIILQNFCLLAFLKYFSVFRQKI